MRSYEEQVGNFTRNMWFYKKVIGDFISSIADEILADRKYEQADWNRREKITDSLKGINFNREIVISDLYKILNQTKENAVSAELREKIKSRYLKKLASLP